MTLSLSIYISLEVHKIHMASEQVDQNTNKHQIFHTNKERHIIYYYMKNDVIDK